MRNDTASTMSSAAKAVTYVPDPRLTSRTLMKSRAFTASRNELRESPSRSESSASGGKRSPGLSSPLTMRSLIFPSASSVSAMALTYYTFLPTSLQMRARGDSYTSGPPRKLHVVGRTHIVPYISRAEVHSLVQQLFDLFIVNVVVVVPIVVGRDLLLELFPFDRIDSRLNGLRSNVERSEERRVGKECGAAGRRGGAGRSGRG